MTEFTGAQRVVNGPGLREERRAGRADHDEVRPPVIVPLDGSPGAPAILPHAITLAHARNSRLILLRLPADPEMMALQPM